MEDNPVDRTKVTFSQAEGLEPLAQPLALGELSKELRAYLWYIIYESLLKESDTTGFNYEREITGWWETALKIIHVTINHAPVDEFTSKFDIHTRNLKALIMHGPYNKVFDFLQHVTRSPDCPQILVMNFRAAFKRAQAAYTVIDDGPTILPVSTPEEGEAIKEAFEDLQAAGFDGARAHLRKAVEHLNAGDNADSVRESIHAVESVARQFDLAAKYSLKPALDALQSKIRVHPALKQGFEKLYGYTSDEKGIRHALLADSAAVDQTDAIFMLGACASFVSYLTGKARTTGLISK